VTPTPQRVRARVKHWVKVLGLGDWRLEVTFARDDQDGSEAFCAPSPEYRFARLNFDISKWKAGEDLDAMVRHELLHCTVAGLATWAETLAAADPAKLEVCRREEEALVTALEQILGRL
jgi:activator of HSP90 ATPase